MPKSRPYGPARVFKASRRLPWGYKAVWLEDYRFDQGQGSYVSPQALAELTGLTAETVTSYRERLLRWKLYERVPRGRGLPHAWRPVLPAHCLPAKEKVARTELVTLAARLDATLPRRAADKGRPDHGPPPQPDLSPAFAADQRPVHRPDASPETGGVGGAVLPSTSLSEAQLHPAVADREQQDGVGASAPERQDGDVSDSEMVERRKAVWRAARTATT